MYDETPAKDDDQTEQSADDPIIKDPIYDIMSDEEQEVAFDRLMKLSEEKQAEESTENDGSES